MTTDFTLLPDLWTRAAATHGTRPCLSFEGRTRNYADVASDIDTVASGLVNLGLTVGDRLALLLPNAPAFVVYLLAAWRVGLVAVPLNPAAPPETIAAQVRATGARTLVSYDVAATFQSAEALLADGTLDRAIVSPFLSALPTAKTVLYRLMQGSTLAAPERSAQARKIVLEATFREAAAARADAAIGAAAPAVTLWTAGSAGPAKAITLTHGQLAANLDQLSQWSRGLVRPGAERVLAVMPFFHSFGLTGVALFGLMGGQELVLMSRFALEGLQKTFAIHRPTMLAGVPSLFDALARPGTAHDLSQVRLGVSAGAPLSPTVRRAFEALCKAPLVEAYGLTEAGPAIAIQPWQAWSKPASAGLPLAGTTISIRAIHAPEERLPAGQAGEIHVRGPQVGENVTLRTGDLGYLDAQGALYLLDRQEDVIMVNGFRVFSRPIEERLLEHPAVLEAAVIAGLDPETGQRPVVFVVLRAGQPVDVAALRAFAAAGLSPLEVPSRFIFRDDLPKTVIGKPDKSALRRLAAPGQSDKHPAS